MIYGLVIHPAPQHIYSDMEGYVKRALRVFGPQPEHIADTIYTPGTSIFYGVLHALDPSWALCAVAQWLLSLGIMGLVWLLARRFYGNAAAVVALALATVHFPFVHYSALFLAENPFTFSCLLWLWLAVRAIDEEDLLRKLAWGVAAGLAAGLAASFKSQICVPLGLVGLFYAGFALRHRRPDLLALALSSALGAAVLFAPMAERCTRLSEGRFCLLANNMGMTVLMGHYGRNGLYRWYDEPRNVRFYFTSPSASLRGYAHTVDLQFGAYDTAANLQAAIGWTREHPLDALDLSLDNVWDLFASGSLWPLAIYANVDFGAWSQRFSWLFVFLPAATWILRRVRAMARLDADALPEWLLLLPLLGIAATSFLSIGETRYRVPFDGFLIVLAAQGWVSAGRRLGSNIAGSGRTGRRGPVERRDRPWRLMARSPDGSPVCPEEVLDLPSEEKEGG